MKVALAATVAMGLAGGALASGTSWGYTFDPELKVGGGSLTS